MGILQARTLEWVAMPSSRRCPWDSNWTHISCIPCISCIGRRVPYLLHHPGSPSSLQTIFLGLLHQVCHKLHGLRPRNFFSHSSRGQESKCQLSCFFLDVLRQYVCMYVFMYSFSYSFPWLFITGYNCSWCYSVTKSCLTLWNPMGCSLPVFPVLNHCRVPCAIQ